MKNKNKLITVLILLLIVTVSCMGKDEKHKTNNVMETAKVEQTKDEKKVEVPKIVLKDKNDKEHNLADYKGKVVFINFWATWCGYCVEELPYLEKVSKDYANDVVVLGISAPKSDLAPQNPDVSKEKIIEFLEKKKITYPVLFDERGKVFAEYGVKFFPTSYVIGRDGYLAGYIPGGLTEENLIKIIEEAIKK
ncbi:TlpA disulfide reductase family protein [Fusobacterium russii]|uniref:TlpA family protein disulfide reductase n=1 Tax=Fusobacterium russii TaxID=854 RepID=UPI0003A7D9BD|nr:TlpA disulfide reductase family protein [Fusobacterium russii]